MNGTKNMFNEYFFVGNINKQPPNFQSAQTKHKLTTSNIFKWIKSLVRAEFDGKSWHMSVGIWHLV